MFLIPFNMYWCPAHFFMAEPIAPLGKHNRLPSKEQNLVFGKVRLGVVTRWLLYMRFTAAHNCTSCT